VDQRRRPVFLFVALSLRVFHGQRFSPSFSNKKPPNSLHTDYYDSSITRNGPAFQMHNDVGDAAGEITAEHKFRGHYHDLVAEDHTYFDIYIDGKCTYADGIVTYLPEHSNLPHQDKYLRDFIVRRDKDGLWIVDQFHDTVSCQTPAANLDLPPPPAGYQKAGAP
jgi:hypothetical protein